MILMLSFVILQISEGDIRGLKSLGWHFGASTVFLSRFSNINLTLFLRNQVVNICVVFFQ